MYHLQLTLILLIPCFATAVTTTVKVGQTFLASSADPRKGSVPWALISHGVAEKLFTVDAKDNVVSQVAHSARKIDTKGYEWEITLQSGYSFSDGTAVDAAHVAACLQELNQDNSAAQASLGRINVTAKASTTKSSSSRPVVQISSERPTHIMDAVLANWAFVVYYKDKEGHFVYTGPYAIKSLTEDRIDLVPNKFYHDGASEKRPSDVQVIKYDSGNDLANAIDDEPPKVDVAFHLPIDRLTDLRTKKGVHIRSFEVGYQYMMHYNVRPASQLSDISVRKAIDLVIDRNAMSQALQGGKGTRSLFPDYSPYFSDTLDPHGHADQAEELLETAGWKLENGKRMKDGNELTVKLVAYPHRPGLVIMQPVIAQELGKLGITVTSVLTGDDWSETQTIIDKKDFDLLLWAQHTLPAGDPAWFLNAFFRKGADKNYAGFESTTVDSLLDELAQAEAHAERVQDTKRVHDEILKSVPVSNLVTPAWHIGLSDRVEGNYKPWGSDYYVIRADTFLDYEPDKSGVPGVGSLQSLLSVAVLLILMVLV